MLKMYILKTDQKRSTQKQEQVYIHESQRNLEGRELIIYHKADKCPS
jgi:hypothetical protein